jgi:hypothetical protein
MYSMTVNGRRGGISKTMKRGERYMAIDKKYNI